MDSAHFQSLVEQVFDIDGCMTVEEMKELSVRISSLPQDAHIAVLNPAAGKSTCFLALLCLGKKRKVSAFWPEESRSAQHEVGRLFTLWHKNVIRKDVVPYVRPIMLRQGETLVEHLRGAQFIYFGEDTQYPKFHSLEAESCSHLVASSVFLEGRL